jgi:hypothetical protein
LERPPQPDGTQIWSKFTAVPLSLLACESVDLKAIYATRPLMPRKPAPKPDDPEQVKRFIETARAAGADEDFKAFDRAFKKVVSVKRKSPA